MKIKVLGEKILVKPIRKDKTEGGLYIPETGEPQMKGEIVAIGNVIDEKSGCKELKEGDVIMWLPFAGTWFDSGENLLVIRPNDVIGILEKQTLLV